MDLFYQPHREILSQMLEFKIRFLLIGGYAVNYHGYSRPTSDLDLWLDPSEENKTKFISMLENYEYDTQGIDYIRSIDFSKPEVFCIGEPPVRTDFLTKVSILSFDEAYSEKITGDIEGMQIPVLQINHLILTKISNNRIKDKLDIEELQKIQKIRGGK
jgi:hypothetical protein